MALRQTKNTSASFSLLHCWLELQSTKSPHTQMKNNRPSFRNPPHPPTPKSASLSVRNLHPSHHVSPKLQHSWGINSSSEFLSLKMIFEVVLGFRPKERVSFPQPPLPTFFFFLISRSGQNILFIVLASFTRNQLSHKETSFRVLLGHGQIRIFTASPVEICALSIWSLQTSPPVCSGLELDGQCSPVFHLGGSSLCLRSWVIPLLLTFCLLL